MNKSDMKSAMESINKKLQNQKNVSYMAHDNKLVWGVLEEMWRDDKRQYMFNGVHYNFTYNPSHTTHGNRSTTPDFTVSRYSKKEMLDADEILAKKEIQVLDFRGGTERLKETLLMENDGKYIFPLEDNKSITTIVGIILLNTNYNILIQHHDTGDVTIFIDNYRFQQR